MNRVSWPLRVSLGLAFVAAGLVVYVWIGSQSPLSGTRPTAQSRATQTGRPWHLPFRKYVPPIENPRLEYADEVGLDDEAIVIGIVVHGKPRAYLREAFHDDPQRHIVTDSIESTPVAITHCDRLGCTRVFAGDELGGSSGIRVAGWREDQTMGLIVQEREYSQSSPKIPLANVPFLELPWGMWRELFPDTLVYVGNARAG